MTCQALRISKRKTNPFEELMLGSCYHPAGSVSLGVLLMEHHLWWGRHAGRWGCVLWVEWGLSAKDAGQAGRGKLWKRGWGWGGGVRIEEGGSEQRPPPVSSSHSRI